ncbi:MAG TPA: sigma-70 family RNA polymerase sigma factor [Vicinamibacterales bacterium]
MIDDASAEASGLARADQSIVARIATGDAGALGDLYDRHARAVYSLAFRIVGDRPDAEEVVQDVFTQVWRQSGRYDRARASVAGWLLMMARARAIDRVRARQSRPDRLATDTVIPDLPATTRSQEAAAIGVQAAQGLKSALRMLPDTLRLPIELAYYEGLSHTAIAERLGEPLGTVKTRMRTALLKLRTAIAGEGEP